MDKKNCGNYEVTCSSCGRPWAVCKEKGGCSKCGDVRFCEYGRKASGCIREKQPGCPMQAVIPSVTVDTVNGIKGLSDCLVHVADINTTYYIDDQHRLLTTWGGPVSVYDYDFDDNPLNLRNQMAYDTMNNVLAIFDKQGIAYKVPISDLNNDYTILENKPQINGHELDGNKTSAELGLQGELTAGANIQINGNVISSTYTAGQGLSLNDGEFSANIATVSEPGIVKPGDGLTVDSDGTINVDDAAPDGFFDGEATVSDCGTSFELDGLAGGKPVLMEIKGKTLQNGSPTPSSPVSIQTVTGEQNIAINGVNYIINLGSIELCELGYSRDKIYEDDGEWKLEKQTAKLTFDASLDETWIKSGQSTSSIFVAAMTNFRSGGFLVTDDDGSNSKMDNFHYSSQKANGVFRFNKNVGSPHQDYLWLELDTSTVSTIDAFKTWLANNPSTLYAPKTTPTVTAITNPALVSQLNAFKLETGLNTISVSSENLSGDLCLEAYRDNWDGTIADISSRIEENYNLISDIKSAKWGLLGISREGSSGNNYHLVYSPDGEKFYHCAKIPAGIGTDASSLTEIKGKFYYFGNNRYSFTEDFVNWAPTEYINTNYGGAQWRLWANTAYYDEDNETLYIYGAYQYSDDTFITPSGNTDYYFKIGYQTAIVNPDGTLNIDPTVHDLLYDDGESYIDPFVAKDPYMGYLLAYKNEVTRKVRVRQMTSLTSVGSGEIENPADGIEAPQLVTTSFGTICYVDGYGLGVPAKTDISGIPRMSAYFLASYEGHFMNSNNLMGLMPIYAPFELRHLGVMQCSKNAFYLAQQLGIETQIPSVCSDYGVLNGPRIISVSSSTSPVLVNFPFALYSVPTSKTLTIRTDFKAEPIRLYVRKGITITWSNDSTIQSSCKGETYTPPTDQILTLYPDTRDNLGGMWVPIDRS